MTSTEPSPRQFAETVAAPGDESRPMGRQRQGLGAVLREMVLELVHYRELLWQMILRDLRIRYKQAVMGFGWAVFMPLIVVGAGFLVKYAMGQMSGRPLAADDFAGMVVKALGWAFFVGAIGFATNSLTGNINLVGKIYFPREVFPLAAVLTQAFDSLLGTAVMGSVLFVLLGVVPSWQWWWLAPLLLMLFLFTTALSLFLSCANVFFRDVKYLVQVVVSFGIFFTPVFYEPALLGRLGSTLMMLNPLSPILEGIRLAAIEHRNLLVPIEGEAGFLIWHPWHLGYAAAWSVLGLLGAWWMFHRLEYVYAEYI